MQPAATSDTSSRFFSIIRNPVKLRLLLIRSLPAAYFSGLRVVSATEAVCTISVPYKWFTKNPFRSTYFACLSMAAEMSTGVLAMGQLWRRRPAVSMLITANEARYHKKATGTTLFTCSDGMAIKTAVENAVATGAAQTEKAYAEGRNKSGELVAEFWFEWSFRKRAD